MLDGSITDVVLLKNLFARPAKIDAEDISLVLDREFCSDQNLQMMFRSHVDFVCGLRSDSEIVEQTFEAEAGSLRLCLPSAFNTSINCFCAMPEILRHSGAEQDKLFIHVYYSKEREADCVMNMTQLIEGFKRHLEDGEVPNSSYFRQFFKSEEGADGNVRYEFSVPA